METFIDENGDRRVKDTEFVFPLVLGTCAWWLGKKANEFNTHKWTVYVRGPNHEDLSHVIQKVTFELHHTFANPRRVVESQPFEVTESGWGEFDINIIVSFVPEARERDVTLSHHLKLYESESAPNTTKKPVMAETYEELVFVEPVEAFYSKASSITPGPAPPPELSCKPWCLMHDDTEEQAKLKECRARVAAAVADLKREYEALR